MKRIFTISLLMAAALWSMDLSAQQLTKKRVGTYIENGNIVVEEANTTIAVDIVVETEEFIAGPYARYAESLLGCNGRLANSTSYRIVSTNVALVENNEHLYACDQKEIDLTTAETTEAFPEFMPDRLSSTKHNDKDRAKSAAEQIYALRTARLELITAELGDGVYGAGLESALREIDRLENLYTELFLGRRNVTTKSYRYYIAVKPAEYEAVPVAEGEEAIAVAEPKMLPQSYIVARFGERVGLVASDNLAGDILLLTINPTEMTYPESNIKGKITYRYANNAEVTLSRGVDVLSERKLPIFELGETITILAPVK